MAANLKLQLDSAWFSQAVVPANRCLLARSNTLRALVFCYAGLRDSGVWCKSTGGFSSSHGRLLLPFYAYAPWKKIAQLAHSTVKCDTFSLAALCVILLTYAASWLSLNLNSSFPCDMNCNAFLLWPINMRITAGCNLRTVPRKEECHKLDGNQNSQRINP